jgi:hypothetical protein
MAPSACLDPAFKDSSMKSSNRTRNFDPKRFFGKAGIIYVIIREHFLPGCVKIGLTTRTVAERVAEANRDAAKTEREFGVADYRSVFEISTPDCGRAEFLIHQRLTPYRLGQLDCGRPIGGQEWFRVDVKLAVQTITAVVNELRNSEPEPTRRHQADVTHTVLISSDEELAEHAALITRLSAQSGSSLAFYRAEEVHKDPDEG